MQITFKILNAEDFFLEKKYKLREGESPIFDKFSH